MLVNFFHGECEDQSVHCMVQKWTNESWPKWRNFSGSMGSITSQCLVILIYKDVPLVWSQYAIWIHLETLGGFIFDDFVWNETHGFL